MDESWPTHGWPESALCREKAYVERVLDTFELRRPEIRVVRLRPGFMLKREAAAEQHRLFRGPLVPKRLTHPERMPALPAIPGDVSTETWLALGLAIALTAIVALTVAVLALGREVGMLRLAVGSQGALEVPDEGPPLGAATPLVERFATTTQTRLALAVFSSDGCALCQTVAPSVELLAREPWLAVEVFDEERHADAWALARVPGSPYAVALDPRGGTVLAKGTFNGLAQLESVLSAAHRRALEAAHA